MTTTFIYALNDPLTGRTRYIGKSSNPRKRFSRHLKDAVSEGCHRARWIRILLSQGLKPDLQILTDVPEDNWKFWEREYVKLYRELGFDLTNGTEGGDGFCSGSKHPFFGKKRSPEVCKKLSLSKLGPKNPMFGKTHTAEARAKLSVANAGKKLSPGHCIKVSAGLLGRKLSPEHCKKIGDLKRGKKLLEDTKEKISRSIKARGVSGNAGKKGSASVNFGKPCSAETKEKISVANKLRWRERKAVA